MKIPFSPPTFTVTTEQMATLTAAVLERDMLRTQRAALEAKIRRMRDQLAHYQALCELRKEPK